MPIEQDVRAAYEVHPYTGKTTRQVCKVDKKTRQVVCEHVEDTGGYMVYFPKGHSIRVRDEKELALLGFDRPAKLIDMETGDETGQVAESLLKRSQRMTHRTRSGENLGNRKGDAA